ncbi:MAG: hypothetical protein LBP96_01745, partial [Bacteroidales bacterium]|nr:hypothetical protein [Bacteroidales bacterium]
MALEIEALAFSIVSFIRLKSNSVVKLNALVIFFSFFTVGFFVGSIFAIGFVVVLGETCFATTGFFFAIGFTIFFAPGFVIFLGETCFVTTGFFFAIGLATFFATTFFGAGLT